MVRFTLKDLQPLSQMKSQYQRALASLPLGKFRYYRSHPSTNDEALAWASQDAPDLSLILADEQTSGRGRMGRKWFTPPGSALAFSLIIRPTMIDAAHLSRTTGLLAVSLAESLLNLGLAAQIKWPNDVLISNRKVAGILVESAWNGDDLDALVLGLGVNVLKTSEPHASQLNYPATSIEGELGHPIERRVLLKDILKRALEWRPKIGTIRFLKTWEGNLAFRGQQVQVKERSGKVLVGKLLGLESDGSLRLQNENNKFVTVHFGDVHLRPLA